MDEEWSEIQVDAMRFLRALYAETGGSPDGQYSIQRIITHLDFNLDKFQKIESYLSGNGLIKHTSSPLYISITQKGKELIEAEPKKAIIKENASHGEEIPEKYSIFISRIHEHKEISKKLKELLESLFDDKIRVFDAYQPDSISVTQDFYDKIKSGVQSCNLMISLLSKTSITHPWIIYETGGAALNDKKIAFICFGDLTPKGLPDPFKDSRIQAITVIDPENFKKHFDILVTEIAQYLNVDPPSVNVLDTDFFNLIKYTQDRK